MTLATLLLVAAAGANGLLTGASLDQSIKQLPARRGIGVLAFSRYSRAADLSNGVAWYATLGIGTAVLTLIAAGACLLSGPSALVPTIALWTAVAATLLHSAATARAAPMNLRQRTVGDDEVALTALFDRFERWQTIRVVCQGITLAAVLVAVAAGRP